MALPNIGDGEQVGDGNTNETLNVGASGQPVALQPSATGKIGCYGATPVVQRASSVQATSNLATSASFGATQLAAVQEIMNTLAGLGLWKGAA